MASLGGILLQNATIVVASLLMLVLAGWLLYLNPHNRANRVFALLLSCRAATSGLGVAQNAAVAAGDIYLARLFLAFVWAVFVLLLFASFRFALVHPRPRTRLATTRIGRRALLATFLVLVGVALAVPTAFASVDPAPGGATFVGGPLYVVSVVPVLALLAAVFARDHRAAETHSQQRSLWLVSLGFALAAAYDAGFQAVALVATPPAPDVVGVTDILHTLGALAALGVAFAYMAQDLRELEVARRGYAKRYIGYVGAALVSGVAVGSLELRSVGGLPPLEELIAGIWRFGLPVFVTYALVKHQLFDIDLKIKTTIKVSAIAGCFVLTYLIVTEIGQNLLNATYGGIMGSVAAGLLIFLLSPLQRLGERVATAAVPGAKPTTLLSPAARLALYQEQAEAAWSDGMLDKRERVMLDRLRDTLGISPVDADRLERAAAATA